MAADPAEESVDLLATLGRAGDAGALEHYADPAYYTKTYRARRHDVDYYVRLGRSVGGPVLEYGVGNGRIALELAQAGVEVWGVELSRPMLADLDRRLSALPQTVRERVHVTPGDMREARLQRRFPLVIAAFNTFLHLYDRSDVEAFLARVRDHLEPGAEFVFDCSVPQPADLARDPARRYGAPRFRHPTTGALTRYSERFEYDPLRQIMLVEMRFEPEDGSEPWSAVLTHRQFFPAELEALLHYSGFREIRFTGDFTDEPPDAQLDSLVVRCRV